MKLLLVMRRLAARLVLLALVAVGLSAVTLETTAQPAAACGGAQADSVAYARSLPQVRPGRSGTYVLALQLDLIHRGYGLTGTAYYGSSTLRAVKTFQRRHHIRASGIVGPKTWTALIGSAPRDDTWPTSTRHTPSFGLRPGDRSEDHVLWLENVIQRVEWGTPRWKAFTTATEAGHGYNAGLVRLVKTFQRKNGIRASGIVGPKTWAAYYRVVSATASWGC